MSIPSSLFLGEGSMTEGRQAFERIFLGRTLLQGRHKEVLCSLSPLPSPCLDAVAWGFSSQRARWPRA